MTKINLSFMTMFLLVFPTVILFAQDVKDETGRELMNKLNAQRSFFLPDEVWENCRYVHNGENILDISTDYWCKLPVEKQIEYAKVYQEGYAKAKGLQVEKTVSKSGASFTFRLIPPGRFWMGSPDGDIDDVRHQVVISKVYYLQKSEITQRQWKAVTGETPWLVKFLMEDNDDHAEDAAAYISWNDIKDKFLSKLGSQFDLPTEAQWEYGCRSGTTCSFDWGKFESELRQHGFERIGSSNAYGLHDITGNDWEWCRDWRKDYTGDSVDPVGTEEGSYRLQRGGPWSDVEVWYLRSVSRFWDDPSYADASLGSRLVFLEVR